MTKKLYIFTISLLILFLQSCKYTRHVPENRYLLVDNETVVNQKDRAPAEAEDILKQQPNLGIWLSPKKWGWFISPNLAIYNFGNGKPKNFWSKIGNGPVILDSGKVERGAEQLQNWYFNKGYFNATSSYDIDSVKKNRPWAKAQYFVRTGDRYYIDTVTYDVSTNKLRGLINFFSSGSLLKKDMPYDADILDAERERLAQIFRNEGFYKFSKNYISFEADTFKQGNFVSLKMVIPQREIYRNDSTLYRDYEIYHINQVYIRPDFPLNGTNIPNDSLEYRDYHFIYDTLRYKPRYFTDAIHFKRGNRYSEKLVKDSYSHLVGYKAFSFTQISFEPSPRDSLGPALNAVVQIAPLPKHSFTIEPEITTIGNLPGGNISISYVNRNFFGAGEALEIRPTFGIQFQPVPGSEDASRTQEIGAEVNMEFPRFLLPFNTVGLLPKRMQPKSRLGIGYSNLTRIEFIRQNFNFDLDYAWKETSLKTHTFSPFHLTYSRITDTLPSFIDGLNLIQQQSFRSELVPALVYNFNYNEQLNPKKKNHKFLNVSLELAGNVFQLLDNWTPIGSINDNGVTHILGVQYYQFGRLEADARYFWNFTRERTWVNRVYSGYILPWGNSLIQTDTGKIRTPPFSRFFFMGGSNDLRAWRTYRLGAGSENNTNYEEGIDSTFETGTFKFLFNSEYRFPIVSFLKGAFFIDVGNIWLTGGLQNEKNNLALDSFVRELAIGSGLGLRLDLDYFVVRFDVGLKVRDPGRLNIGDPWVIDNKPLKNLSYNIALGYPF